eukprot:PRCOL_00005236-RA
MDDAMLDDIISRLLEVRNSRVGKPVALTENEIRALCVTARDIFMSQPCLLELEAPIKICDHAQAAERELPGVGGIAGRR